MTVQSNWSFLRSEIKVLRASLVSSHLTATRLFYQPGRWNMLKLKRCGHVVAVGSYTKFSRLDWDENHVWTPWISTFLHFFTCLFHPEVNPARWISFYLHSQQWRRLGHLPLLLYTHHSWCPAGIEDQAAEALSRSYAKKPSTFRCLQRSCVDLANRNIFVNVHNVS